MNAKESDTEDLGHVLLNSAKQAAENAYAPYSHFSVGAAVMAENGRIFPGANVENTSLGLTICAERTAIACAISAGARALKAIAIYSPQADDTVVPCGACLQVMAEFTDDLIVYSGGNTGHLHKTTLKTLLPHIFGKSE